MRGGGAQQPLPGHVQGLLLLSPSQDRISQVQDTTEAPCWANWKTWFFLTQFEAELYGSSLLVHTELHVQDGRLDPDGIQTETRTKLRTALSCCSKNESSQSRVFTGKNSHAGVRGMRPFARPFLPNALSAVPGETPPSRSSGRRSSPPPPHARHSSHLQQQQR